MTWNVTLKATLLLSVAMMASPASAQATAHEQVPNLPRVFWHGMCIPASQLKIPLPYPPSFNSSGGYLGQTRGRWTYVHIPPRELKKDFPHWVEPPLQTNLGDIEVFNVPGMDVFMAYDIPIASGYATPFMLNLYSLEGPYKYAKVTKLNHSGLYEVRKAFRYPGDPKWRVLFKINPRASHKPPINEWHRWFAGFCTVYKESQRYPSTCTFDYATQGIAFEYAVTGKNFLLYRQIDDFLAHKVHEWRAACPG